MESKPARGGIPPPTAIWSGQTPDLNWSNLPVKEDIIQAWESWEFCPPSFSCSSTYVCMCVCLYTCVCSYPITIRETDISWKAKKRPVLEDMVDPPNQESGVCPSSGFCEIIFLLFKQLSFPSSNHPNTVCLSWNFLPLAFSFFFFFPLPEHWASNPRAYCSLLYHWAAFPAPPHFIF